MEKIVLILDDVGNKSFYCTEYESKKQFIADLEKKLKEHEAGSKKREKIAKEYRRQIERKSDLELHNALTDLLVLRIKIGAINLLASNFYPSYRFGCLDKQVRKNRAKLIVQTLDEWSDEHIKIQEKADEDWERFHRKFEGVRRLT